MKKFIFLFLFLCFSSLTAQVLYTENFDNYNLGNLGTDPTGVIPGKGGWLTSVSQTTPNNSYFTITNEQNKGKVLTVNTPVNTSLRVLRNDLDSFIDQRSQGYNVFKFEIDYYTGEQYYTGNGNASPYVQLTLLFGQTYTPLFRYKHQLISPTDDISAYYNEGILGVEKPIKLGNGTGGDSLPVNTWVTFIVYLDYTNKKIYFETPYFNKIVAGDFLSQSTSTNLIKDFKPRHIIFLSGSDNVKMVHKYDNIKITALNTVPPEVVNLSVNEKLATKFNLYPNPATSLVNITNAENMQIQQITVYDIAGKEIKKQTYTNENQIQLNVENLSNGTYMLHLQTNEGTAVKKLVKK